MGDDEWLEEQAAETIRQAAAREPVPDPGEVAARGQCRHCGEQIVLRSEFTGVGYDGVWMHERISFSSYEVFRVCRAETVAEP